mgnify:CR=1 FL=1
MQLNFSFDYRNTYEYRTYIETLTPYQKYLFDNDRTEYVSEPRVYFKRLYTQQEIDYLASYGVYHLILNEIHDNFCVHPFSKNPPDFRFIKSEFDYLESLYGPTYKPDLSRLIRNEELVNQSKIFWNSKIAMSSGNWKTLKTILESNLNVVDEHFICLYYEHFWYSDNEDLTPLDIALQLGFDINNNSTRVVYTGGTLLSWILISCSDSYRYDISLTKSEDYILELIRYCFERGATHPKYTIHNYTTIMLYMGESKIKDLFEYYENQIEGQFDFSKYCLLKPNEKARVRNLFLATEKNREQIKPCMISDMFGLFTVKTFFE